VIELLCTLCQEDNKVIKLAKESLLPLVLNIFKGCYKEALLSLLIFSLSVTNRKDLTARLVICP